MITREDDVDIHALRRQGWTITAIARHVGRDRKTVRDYLNGKREPGVRKRAARSVRPVRRVRDGQAGRGPASVGHHAVRRAPAVGVRRVVSDADPGDPGPPAPPGLHRLRAGHGTGERDHPAPGRGGNPMGLAGPARPARRVGVGVDGASAGRLAGPLRSVARLPVPGDGPAAPGRGAGPDQPRSGRAHPAVAVRPDGHRLPPRRRAGSPPPSPASRSTTA